MMGGGSGHIFDMIARLKANRALRKNKGYFKVMSEYESIQRPNQFISKEATAETMASVRLMMARERRKIRRRTAVAVILTICITVGVVWSFTDRFLAWFA